MDKASAFWISGSVVPFNSKYLIRQKDKKGLVPRGFEPSAPDSESGVLTRGPRDDLDAQLPDIFGKSVPLRNFKKWY